MGVDTIALNGQLIGPGEDKLVTLNIARLPTHTNIDLPVYVFRGNEPGPSLLLTGGLHGNETNGIEIVRRLIRRKMLKPKCGTVIAMPIVNVYGFLQSARYLPDGKDLNRSFPGNKTGSLARRVSYVVMNEIIPWIDYGIDFHTGGASMHNYPQVRCELKDPINKMLSDYFKAPITLNSAMIDKSFRKAAWKAGKHIIVYEGGESLRFDNLAIEEGINGALRLMKGLGMIDSAPKQQLPVITLKGSTWIRARYSGMFNPMVEPGQLIKKNQTIGKITDPYGESVTMIKASSGGHVIGLNYMPIVNAGDALLHLGKE